MEMISPGSFTGINYWAVLVAALATFFLGAVWYSPALFETAWMTANGYSREQVDDLQSSLGAAGFGSVFIAYLAMSLILAVFAAAANAQVIFDGLVLGFLAWAGFAATTGLAVNMFSTRPLASWAIDAAFQLVAFLIAGAILALWR